METTTIKVVVALTIESDEELTRDDKEEVVNCLDYNFSFSEILNQNHVKITETEITETL